MSQGRVFTVEGYRLGNIVFKESDSNILSYTFKDTWLVIEEDTLHEDGTRGRVKHHYPGDAVTKFTVTMPTLSREHAAQLYNTPFK